MKDVLDFLDQSQLQYFATIGLDGKPKVRPFQFMFEQDNKLWFCSSNKKMVYKELEAQPYIELCASNDKMSWLRIEGKVVFSDRLDIKQRVFDHSPLVKSIYKDVDNPDLEVFYLTKVTATISKIGEAPKNYLL